MNNTRKMLDALAAQNIWIFKDRATGIWVIRDKNQMRDLAHENNRRDAFKAARLFLNGGAFPIAQK